MINALFCWHYCQRDIVARLLEVHFFLHESSRTVLDISTRKPQILRFGMGSTYLLHFIFICFMLNLALFSFPGVIPNLPIWTYFSTRSCHAFVFIPIMSLFVRNVNLPLRIFFNEFGILWLCAFNSCLRSWQPISLDLSGWSRFLWFHLNSSTPGHFYLQFFMRNCVFMTEQLAFQPIF